MDFHVLYLVRKVLICTIIISILFYQIILFMGQNIAQHLKHDNFTCGQTGWCHNEIAPSHSGTLRKAVELHTRFRDSQKSNPKGAKGI